MSRFEPEPPALPRLLTATKAAKMLGVSRRTVTRWYARWRSSG